MKINRNMLAVGANQHLFRNENRLSQSMERLSSGYKLNRAGDNPAGLAISHKMKSQIDGLDRAKSNTTDAQSALRIADGALNETSSILQRIRELCVQAGNDTNSNDERTAIQNEINKLTEEVDRISTDTEFNTKTLLDGSLDTLVTGSGLERMYITDSVLPGNYSIVVNRAYKASYGFTDPVSYSSGVVSINGVNMEVSDGMDEDDFYALLRDTAELAGCVATRSPLGGAGSAYSYKIESKEYGSSERVDVKVESKYNALARQLGLNWEEKDAEGNVIAYSNSHYAQVQGVDATVQLGDHFSKTATVHTDGLRVTITDLSGFTMDFSIKEDVNDISQSPAVQTFFDIKVTDIGAMTIQMGANQYQDMDIRIPEVSAKSLYLDKVDVTVVGGTDKALVTLDKAIGKLNDIRARIGAFTNRLEYAEESLAETNEDMTRAYSGILDTDMAEEMVEYTQRNVLEQASISVLAQANDLPQQVLSLLQ